MGHFPVDFRTENLHHRSVTFVNAEWSAASDSHACAANNGKTDSPPFSNSYATNNGAPDLTKNADAPAVLI